MHGKSSTCSNAVVGGTGAAPRATPGRSTGQSPVLAHPTPLGSVTPRPPSGYQAPAGVDTPKSGLTDIPAAQITPIRRECNAMSQREITWVGLGGRALRNLLPWLCLDSTSYTSQLRRLQSSLYR